MSIKKLFEDSNKTRTFVADTNQKDAFEAVESERNVEQKLRAQQRYVPQIDYSEPENFVKYGSARLYYESAFNRILDYYPYDGSEAEITKFHNNNLDIEEYILEKRYPKSTGYITLGAPDGFTISSRTTDGYGIPTTNEYIDFKGGPGTGSATSLALKDLLPNPYSDSSKASNIYSSNIYTDAGLPSDYGKGSRQSNLRANFDDGVTIEFWMKTGSMQGVNSDKQVIFDSWNNKAASSADYGRITLELTGTRGDGGSLRNPFILTVQSGASQPCSVDTMKLLGNDSLHLTLGEWNHYAIRLYNTGSSNDILKTELYVNGYLNDSSSWAPYSLNTELEITNAFKTTPAWFLSDIQYRYTSFDSLQGWWRFNKSTITTTSPEPDASGNNRTGSIDASAEAPSTSTSTPSAYIQSIGSNVWGGDAADAVRIGTAATWNAIIGNDTDEGSTEMMTFAAWVYKTGDGGDGKGRIFDAGDLDIALWSGTTERVHFTAKLGSPGATVRWQSVSSGVFNEDEWTHIAITYDARNTYNNPILYIDGEVVDMELSSGTLGGVYDGISGQEVCIGNNAAGNRNWEGNIADFAIWNTCLGIGEIRALYHAGLYTQQFRKITELNSKAMAGRIGALITSPNDSSAPAGAGRLSGSLDEFRYWKSARTPKQIGEHWFSQVRGGANSDIANADLGIYYKFNEGITNNTAIDSVVLDYAGRAVNGVWTGYTTDSRNTGSAIVSASAASFEFEDPIIRSTHPSVVSLKSELITSGTSYDYNNNASLMSLMPGWIQDEAADSTNTDLYYINHIVGTYLDKLHLQISQLPHLRHVNYVSSSQKPLPFSRHLPQSLGLYAPEMFIEADVLETFADRSSDMLFENKLNETKNLIYQNLYNNLAHIFKSKGTERAMRNVLRCFNIDNGLYSVNINSNNEEYILRNNFKHSLLEKNFIDFNNIENSTGVVYSAIPSTYASVAEGLVAMRMGAVQNNTAKAKSERPFYGMTLEANILFPAYSKMHSSYERDSSFDTCSLFGIEQAPYTTLDKLHGFDGDLVYTPQRESSFRVYAIRESQGSKNIFFRLKAPRTDIDIELNSPVFLNVYDNEPWNLSVRVEPNAPLRRAICSGTIPPNRMYKVIFSGFNAKTANEFSSFTVSKSINETPGTQFITGAARIVVGAERTDIAGALVHRSDVQVGGISYWAKSLDDETLKTHARDFENIGISGSLETISPFASGSLEQLNYNTRLLNWNFENITGSDDTGNFLVQDFSSGSFGTFDLSGDYWLPKMYNYFIPGQAKHFPASSTAVSNRKEINTYKFINPEQVVASDLVQTFSDEDVLFPNLKKEEIVPNYVFSIEKSIYNAVTEQMLDFFAGAVDFHNLIGNPINNYRHRYKEIEKLRSVFFQRVSNVSRVEKFLSYYKWFDESITTILSQLVPASSEFVDNLLNVVESHVLERNKYQNRLNIIDSNTFWLETDLTATPVSYEAPIYAAGAFALVSPPESPRPTTKGVQYWNTRAERSMSDISSGVPAIDIQRETFRKIIWSRPHISSSMPRLFTAEGVKYTPSTYKRNNSSMLPHIKTELDNTSTQKFIWDTPERYKNEIKGGINFNRAKSLEYAYSAVYPGGPVKVDSGVFVPQNVLLAFVKDAEPLTNFETVSWPDDLVRKRAKTFKVQHGREWEDGIGYKNTKSEKSFPFNVLSSSVEVRTGYNKEVIDQVGKNIEITNLHTDAYGSMAEVPVQGPFTEEVVGGHQSRHVPLNNGTDTPLTRPEAWRLLLGTCAVVPSGAIGLVGSDYPPVDFNPPAGTSPDRIYPYPRHAKAYLYRDFIAKSPVNIKNIKSTNKTDTNTVAGNYRFNHEILYTFGAFNNPHHFIKQQPALPVQISQSVDTTNIRTILNVHRGAEDHFENIADYDVSYLEGTSSNSIIICRFAAPGGIEIETKGYQDFKSSEYSPYNALTYRNLTVKKPSQGPSGSISEPHGGSPSTSRVYDIHGQDYGLNSHRARHAARFGRDSLNVTNPGATYDQLPAMFKTNRNRRQVILSTNADNTTFVTGSRYDNYNVQHPIPQSDRQYMWISNSIVDGSDIKYAGFQRTVLGDLPPGTSDFSNLLPWRSSSAGYIPYWSFVDASDATTGSFYQPTNRLNIVIRDPIDYSSDTAGSTSSEDYTNTSLVGNKTNPNYLNQLLASRGCNYGWGWNRTRQGDNRFTQHQKKTNTLRMITNISTRETASYRLPPVSLKGRQALVNYDQIDRLGETGEPVNITLKISNTNNSIYFPEYDLNVYAAPNREAEYDPLDSVLSIVRKDSPQHQLNWLLYSQNVFPSTRNEFASASSRRLDFDNEYWRSSQEERIALGNTLPNSWEVRNVGGSEALIISQSSWVLDAPVNFLTRSGIECTSSNCVGSAGMFNLYNTEAGELQNTYFKYLTVGPNRLRVAATYARTHVLDTMASVVSPTGPRIPETGSITPRGSASFRRPNLLNQPYGGEAVWEAGTQAGTIGKVPDKAFYVFASASSEPWFGTYDLFNENIKLKAKGFSVVPEYRMSEHVEKYYQAGPMDVTLDDTFEIPGTIFDSSQADFYRDFSNSDFLEEFLGLKARSLLNASEIRISCTGAIKYNPYKGFYPAQRTKDLVAQFSSSFISQLSYHRSDLGTMTAERVGTSGLQSKGAGVLKNLADCVFSPGILYNSIRSGIAVDYPVIHDPSKRYTASFGDSSLSHTQIDLTNNYALMITGSNPRGSEKPTGYSGGEIWDRRIPFEAIIQPKNHLPGYDYYSMESHPSMSLINYSDGGGVYRDSYASMDDGGDPLYSMMAENFFGQATSFFLKNSGLTKLTSKTITDDLRFKEGEVYVSRIKLRRSLNNPRFYDYEYDSNAEPATTDGAGAEINAASAWATAGAKVISSGSTYSIYDSVFPVPQDPKRNPYLQETFTMYSRPSAFGPPMPGRPTGSNATSGAFEYAAMDSFEGINPAFTPPYMNGEAWADLIFRPSASVAYDLERILAETEVVSWRFDAGYRVDPASHVSASAKINFTNLSSSALIVSGSSITLSSTDGYTITYVAHSGSTAGDSGSSGVRFNFIEHASAGADAAYAMTQLSSAINSNTGHNFAGNNTKFVINKNITENVLQLTQSIPGKLGETPIESNDQAKSSGILSSSFFSRNSKLAPMPALIPVERALQPDGTLLRSPADDLTVPSIYDGYRINVNSMQLTSSLEIFGVERVLEQKTGKFGRIGDSTNKSVGKKWIISPKWECPMLNFNDTGIHPITNADGTLTLPLYASGSVPRGMWHQFGVQPRDTKLGIFMEIDTIPEDWLRNHYDVTINPTPYNNYNPGDNKDSKGLHKRVKSLAKLCGFDETNSTTRLGDLKEKVTIKEAVVAIPYVLDALPPNTELELPFNSLQKRERKKFVSIPKKRFKAALKESAGSATGDSPGIAGASIRKLVTALETYVFPPQFDFVNNPDISPMAMYVFEFKYELDKDDLSYIWQNIAPRNYKKLDFQAASISHNLGNNEIINEEILMNENLRWMVFKVKQRADKTYFELLPDRVGSSTSQIDFKTGKRGEYKFGFNWPYDYLSFVELIKMDVDILLKK